MPPSTSCCRPFSPSLPLTPFPSHCRPFSPSLPLTPSPSQCRPFPPSLPSPPLTLSVSQVLANVGNHLRWRLSKNTTLTLPSAIFSAMKSGLRARLVALANETQVCVGLRADHIGTGRAVHCNCVHCNGGPASRCGVGVGGGEGPGQEARRASSSLPHWHWPSREEWGDPSLCPSAFEVAGGGVALATGCQGNPCSTGIRWGVSPAAQMGCLRNRSGSPSGADQL